MLFRKVENQITNTRETHTANGITYLPIYYIMFLRQ